MEKTVNEKLLKITGKAIVPTLLNLGHDYYLAVHINIQNVTDSDNQDGTINKIYSGKLIGEALIQNDKGNRLKIESKESQSKKLRFQIMQTNDSDRDDEEEYQYEMVLLRHFWPRIKPLMKKWKENGE